MNATKVIFVAIFTLLMLWYFRFDTTCQARQCYTYDRLFNQWSITDELAYKDWETSQNHTAMPKIGAIVDGYRFKGGDPNIRENWQAVK